MSSVVNQPARLEVEATEVIAADGRPVRITLGEEGSADAVHAFSRRNTGRQVAGQQIDQMLATEEGRKLLEDLSNSFQHGRTPNLGDEASKALLGDFSRRLGLDEASRLFEGGEVHRAEDLIGKLGAGAIGTTVLSGTSLAAVGAVVELANLAGEAGSRISGIIKAPNITAHAGTPLTARVVESRVVRIPLDPRPPAR
jgi:hypothetical protein